MNDNELLAEIRQLKAARANLQQSHDVLRAALMAERAVSARLREHIDAFEGACAALTGGHGGET